MGNTWLLRGMGITVVGIPDGRVQLRHSCTFTLIVWHLSTVNLVKQAICRFKKRTTKAVIDEIISWPNYTNVFLFINQRLSL